MRTGFIVSYTEKELPSEGISSLHSKGMPFKFKTVLESTVKVVNLIKARPLNNSLFPVLCNEIGSEYI